MRPGTVPTTSTTPPVVQDFPTASERHARCGERVARWSTRGDTIPPAAERAPADLLELDRLALEIRRAINRITLPLARACAVFVRDRQFTVFGFARLDDCARERLGRSGRWVRDQAALGEATDRLPPLGAAVTGADGGEPVGTVAALLIARVADPESLAGWPTLARSSTVRELRATIARAREGGSAAAAPAGEGGASEGGAAEGGAAEGGVGKGGPAEGGSGESDRAVAGADDDLVAVRLPLPEPVRRAFDEATDLFRAVEGRESGIADFVEALCAETAAGGAPFEVDTSPVRHGPSIEAIEAAMARATSRWRHLRDCGRGDGTGADSGDTLEDDGRADADGPTGIRAMLAAAARLAQDTRTDPDAVDRRLRGLLRISVDLERRLGDVLADLAARGGWARLLFADAGHYAEERLRLSRTVAADRARLARALRCRPVLRAAVAEGRLGCAAALLVLRALGPEPGDIAAEEAWVASAAAVSIKRLRDEVRAARAASHRAGAAAAATGRRSAYPLDDEAWHASLRREPGRSRRRILRAGLEALGAFGQSVPAAATTSGDPDVFHPDSAPLPADPDVFLRLRLPQTWAARFVAAIEAARAARSRVADAVPWDAPFERPGAPPSLLAARMYTARSRRVPAWVSLLALLEDFVFTWDPVESPPARAADAFHVRDGWRCAAPGCTSRRNLEEHHVVYRSRGGDDDPANLVTLCRFHHQRGEHDGLARVRGRAPLDLAWRLGRADLGTWYRNERRVPPPGGRMPPPGERWR
jgi:hypothetical protein